MGYMGDLEVWVEGNTSPGPWLAQRYAKTLGAKTKDKSLLLIIHVPIAAPLPHSFGLSFKTLCIVT